MGPFWERASEGPDGLYNCLWVFPCLIRNFICPWLWQLRRNHSLLVLRLVLLWYNIVNSPESSDSSWSPEMLSGILGIICGTAKRSGMVCNLEWFLDLNNRVSHFSPLQIVEQDQIEASTSFLKRTFGNMGQNFFTRHLNWDWCKLLGYYWI